MVTKGFVIDEKLELVTILLIHKSCTRLDQVSGSLSALFHYEAPEVHESRSFSDRSDVYSFGVVMLELLTGREPYDR